ncbi:MAG: Dam-replacing domain protein [Alphaproteobacteria bacterium]|nr:MAG: Dam-replacing domain protein [Alphaproteobacteria bacterium]
MTERPDWKSEVRQCIIKLGKTNFTLSDMYLFIPDLKKRTGRSENVDARIRENLQKLRDDGFIQFLEKGHYRRTR